MDDHISLGRLWELSDAAIIDNNREVEHLTHCRHCRELLRRFAQERVRKFTEEKAQRQKSA